VSDPNAAITERLGALAVVEAHQDQLDALYQDRQAALDVQWEEHCRAVGDLVVQAGLDDRLTDEMRASIPEQVWGDGEWVWRALARRGLAEPDDSEGFQWWGYSAEGLRLDVMRRVFGHAMPEEATP